MTSYLQRLFDRAAGLAGGPATALSPTFSSRSPIAEADQRLNVPGLAASLFALSPGLDTPTASDDDALAGLEEPPATPMPRRAAPPARVAETPMPPLLAEPPAVAPIEAPPLQPQRPVTAEPRLPLLPDRPLLTPAFEASETRATAPADTPPQEPASAMPTLVPAPRERPASQPPAEPAPRPAALEPIPPPPRAVPEQAAEPVAAHETLQSRQAEQSATALEPSPTQAIVRTDERVVRLLEPAPLPMPEPLPAPAPPPRDGAELRGPTVTRREVVAPPALEAAAQPPARTMPATAESVSRIGKLMPRRRAQLVFGLRRR